MNFPPNPVSPYPVVPVPPKPKSPILGLTVFGVVAGLGLSALLVMPTGCEQLHDAYPLAMKQLDTCPEIKTVLGPNIRRGWGVGNFKIRSGGGTSSGSWSIPITGDRASGTYNFTASKLFDDWTFGGGQIMVSSEKKMLIVGRTGCTTVVKGPTGTSVDWDSKCTGGDAQSCVVLGSQHMSGAGMPKDAAKARAYFAKACALGDKSGCLLRDTVK